MPTKVLRLPQVIERCGFSRSQLYKLAARNAFPRSINIGVRAVAWLEADIEEWVKSRNEASPECRAEASRVAAVRRRRSPVVAGAAPVKKSA